MFKKTRYLLKLANVLNWFFGLIAAVMLFLWIFFPDTVPILSDDYREVYPNFNDRQLALIEDLDQWGFCLIIAIVPFAHLIFIWLLAMIDEYRSKNIFTLENSKKLKFIAWMLFIINMFDVAYIWLWILEIYSFVNTDYEGPFWTPPFSITSWFAVLLIFVLAEIFKQGAIMREDLEGTI